MYLTHQERQPLRDASGEINGSLDLYQIVVGILQTNPGAFHTKETLPDRVFYDEPMRNEPHKAFMRPASTQLRGKHKG
ncbi:hypothetical protein KNO81_41185 [Paraburkholderia sediminicola]|jgi:hypothetical protein|nr:hypothetical protein [Paraburkholderia sediminicola]